MIIGALAIVMLSLFGFGGGADQSVLPTDFNKLVKQHVADDTRQAQILATGKQLEADNDDYEKELEKQVKQLEKLSQDYDTTVADVQALYEEIYAERDEAFDDVIEARLKLAELFTREEWSAVFAPPDNAKQ